MPTEPETINTQPQSIKAQLIIQTIPSNILVVVLLILSMRRRILILKKFENRNSA